MAKVYMDTLVAGEISKTIIIDSPLEVSSILVTDANTHEQIISDISIDGREVTITLDKAYRNALNIIITGIGDDTPTINLQDKNIIPSADNQIVEADSGYDGLGTVIVDGDIDLVSRNIKKNVNIFGVVGTYEGSGSGIGEFSQYDYIDVQTADQTLLTTINPLGVIPKLVLIKALTNPNDISKIGTGMFDPLCGVAYDYELPTSYNGVYAYSPVDTLGTTTHTYVMNASTFAARRYSAGYTWDTSVTYRVHVYA